MTHFIKKATNLLCDIMFTVHCPYCSKVINRKEYACQSCKRLFPENAITEYAAGGYKCAVAFPYNNQYRNAIIQFKFNGCGRNSKQLAFMVVRAINEIFPNMAFDVITCVPMHKKALKKRGYNQAELLARDCAEIMNIEYADILEKFKENQIQHNLKSTEREKNVKGVYRILDRKAAYGKNVLIIDDIITTGNTLGECAGTIMKSGCKSICCATLCTAGR